MSAKHVLPQLSELTLQPHHVSQSLSQPYIAHKGSIFLVNHQRENVYLCSMALRKFLIEGHDGFYTFVEMAYGKVLVRGMDGIGI